jgi:methylmalonyl-CoA mutase cobalamin-binding domain/chain
VTSRQQILKSIAQATVSLNADLVRSLCLEAVEQGISGYEVMLAGVGKGMELVGRKYESGEYFLTELVTAGEIMKQILELLKPYLDRTASGQAGTIVTGTIQGDLHDIGKNIFNILAIGAGFQVIDLGVDVPPDKFLDAAKANDARVVGISALLTTTMLSMSDVIEALNTAGLRDRVRVIIGGAPISEDFGKRIGADAAASDAVNGLKKVKQWLPAVAS